MRLPARRGSFRTRLHAAHRRRGGGRSRNLIDMRTRRGRTTIQSQQRANIWRLKNR